MVIETDDEKSMISSISARKMTEEIKKHQGKLSLASKSTIQCHRCFPQRCDI